MRLGALINDTRTGRTLQSVFIRGVSYPWMRAAFSRRMIIEGIDAFADLSPERGVLLVANHRSYFDFYAISIAFLAAGTPWVSHLSFPVRAEFFYSRLSGVAVNLMAGAGVMHPPLFRDRAKARLNREAVSALSATLERKGWIVGFHPEGTRNKGDDPYTLLPMQLGAAELALRSGALVVPVFINGLGNGLFSDIRRGFRARAASDPCVCVFGSPVPLEPFRQQIRSVRLYKQVADHLGKAILRLAEQERGVRADCTAGRVPASDKRWLRNQPASRLYAKRISRAGHEDAGRSSRFAVGDPTE